MFILHRIAVTVVDMLNIIMYLWWLLSHIVRVFLTIYVWKSWCFKVFVSHYIFPSDQLWQLGTKLVIVIRKSKTIVIYQLKNIIYYSRLLWSCTCLGFSLLAYRKTTFNLLQGCKLPCVNIIWLKYFLLLSWLILISL